ncbi:MAG TPA: glycosyltransferase, partial [Burkholderiaceae bacterium]|nr:glycosyltransferase [Burkholderiaceae bacterium]
VDDGSTDRSGRELIAGQSLSAIRTIEEIALIRNHGNQKALAVGIGYVASTLSVDFLIVMDSDHEARPDDIPMLLARCAQADGQEVVFAERSKRSENFVFRAFYFAYRCIFRAATGRQISMGNFCVVPAALIQPTANISELWSHFPASLMRARIPFDRIPTTRGKRLFGNTSMHLVPLVAHAFGAFAIFADVIATRGLMLATILSLLMIAAGILVVVLRLATNLVAFGSANILIALLFMMLIQIIGFTILLLMVTSSMRLQPPMIPQRDYRQFVSSITRLWDAAPAKPVLQRS